MKSSEAGGHVEHKKSYAESYIWWNDRPDEALLSKEESQRVEEFLESIRKHQATRQPVTIPLVYDQKQFNKFVTNEVFTIGSNKLKALKSRIKLLPPLKEVPLGRKPRIILEIGKRLGVFPKTSPDNYLYKTPKGNYEYTPLGGNEAQGMEALYNCIPVRGADYGRNTYWHELFSGDMFSSYVNGIVVTVNKNFPPTTAKGLVGVINKARMRP